MEREKIASYVESLGLDTYGFVPCRTYEELRPFYETRQEKKLQNEFEEKEIEKRIQPSHYMEDGKTIISIAFPYAHEMDEEEENGFSIYTKRADYHRVVKQYLMKVCQYIETLGGKAECFVDSNTLPERYIAYLAGVGFIGRNNMIITKRYGSYVFLGEIITNLPIRCEETRRYEELGQYVECGECTRCYQACPTKSINKAKVNSNICLSYLTQKKELSDQELSLLKGNVFGCDYCQLPCPYNQTATKNVLPEFQTLSYMNENIETYAGMDNKLFKEKISGTSCGWRGKNVIRRNALIHMNSKNLDVTKYRGDSDYINQYIDRIIKNDKKGLPKI